MSVSTTPGSTAGVSVDNSASLTRVGIELEYPAAPTHENPLTSTASSSRSLGVREEFRQDYECRGTPGTDHCGAEIRSDILDLMSNEPEEFYQGTIEWAEDHGVPFAACGRGSSVFGCHHHLSNMTSEQVDFLHDITHEKWFRVFACSTITANSLDPWRHGGVNLPGEPSNYGGDPVRHRGGRHYEWRFPDPVLPEHHHLIIEFLRTLATAGPEAAELFAREKVAERNPALTPIQRYRDYEEAGDDWPPERAFQEDRQTNKEAAEIMYDLMQ